MLESSKIPARDDSSSAEDNSLVDEREEGVKDYENRDHSTSIDDQVKSIDTDARVFKLRKYTYELTYVPAWKVLNNWEGKVSNRNALHYLDQNPKGKRATKYWTDKNSQEFARSMTKERGESNDLVEFEYLKNEQLFEFRRTSVIISYLLGPTMGIPVNVVIISYLLGPTMGIPVNVVMKAVNVVMKAAEAYKLASNTLGNLKIGSALNVVHKSFCIEAVPCPILVPANLRNPASGWSWMQVGGRSLNSLIDGFQRQLYHPKTYPRGTPRHCNSPGS
ncbi:thiazole synthase, partial [Striga asiatica]